ncbi:putative CRIB domain superfamily protein [Helianthus annuus]|uniref:CRIB domain superfamily protein n=1 Tax=Helianthus annuus TaxID=4232 RepID=A0A9K3NNH2_HELAN|nr:putative CRIB domain superfamily protein [Helianthus annuus]KAJ0570545.1 putative Rho GTPase-activating protein 1-5 [Helianthus annuus]KAJ0584892.1 putative Rho GTPase-activating protein 1-5 [Helianthus annuus]KAJ0747460.1 putative Rho GTPase-activating protein 1-5 [Helianthus annuus]KAJ0923090.1 putative CRIB domain superfamily protein [Helianthus annuus]
MMEMVMLTRGGGENAAAKGGGATEEEQNQLSLVALLVAALRKSMVACRVDHLDDHNSALHQIELGWPTSVQHLTHVTFNRFHGFLGLPIEFEVEIPFRVPNAR